ncbi:hypothetical protein lbkm_3513 [Lachnospiraceae bacterium KM106-2]|nr:hypothetical protein lbkm_3513 [Lachnospiraceae bacterium KM106-2]
MRKIREKRRASIFKVFLLVIVICSILTYNKLVLQKEANAKQVEATKLQKKVDQLKEEQKELKKDSKLTKKEIEKIARDRLGMVYEDEIIFRAEDGEK